MRSVHLFPSLDVGRLTSLLNGVGERRGMEWFGIADGVLEVVLTHYASSDDLLRGVEAEASGPRARSKSCDGSRANLEGVASRFSCPVAQMGNQRCGISCCCCWARVDTRVTTTPITCGRSKRSNRVLRCRARSSGHERPLSLSLRQRPCTGPTDFPLNETEGFWGRLGICWSRPITVVPGASSREFCVARDVPQQPRCRLDVRPPLSRARSTATVDRSLGSWPDRHPHIEMA